tara:strand:+ start:31675 stop:31830 length:156 start_codon:yes stop_codon:yes gene_type:complete
LSGRAGAVNCAILAVIVYPVALLESATLLPDRRCRKAQAMPEDQQGLSEVI